MDEFKTVGSLATKKNSSDEKGDIHLIKTDANLDEKEKKKKRKRKIEIIYLVLLVPLLGVSIYGAVSFFSSRNHREFVIYLEGGIEEADLFNGSSALSSEYNLDLLNIDHTDKAIVCFVQRIKGEPVVFFYLSGYADNYLVKKECYLSEVRNYNNTKDKMTGDYLIPGRYAVFFSSEAEFEKPKITFTIQNRDTGKVTEVSYILYEELVVKEI